jgi:hypothetical protein
MACCDLCGKSYINEDGTVDRNALDVLIAAFVKRNSASEKRRKSESITQILQDVKSKNGSLTKTQVDEIFRRVHKDE